VKLKFPNTVSLKRKIMIPLTLALGALMCAFVFDVHRIQYKNITNDVERHLKSTRERFEERLDSDAKLISEVINMLSGARQIQSAWKTGNRAALLEATSPFLARLRIMYKATHLYFHAADRTNSLRVHNPDKYGDPINRYTMMEAEKTGRPSSGIELGPLGTFTLRVVHPWHVEGKLAGYIEIGKDINHIAGQLQGVLGLEIYVAIHKKHLVRREWEKGMRMLGLESDWDLFPSSVIVSRTLEVVPEIIGDFLSTEHHEPMKMATGLDVTIDGRIYHCGFIPLYDVGGTERGEIVVMFNVTDQVSWARSSILTIGVICVVVGIALFILFSMLLERVQRQLEGARLELVKSNEQLRREIGERRLAEKELRKSSKELHDLSRHLQSLKEEERTSIAREIHDELGQILTVLQIELSDLSIELPKDKTSLREKTESMSELINESIQSVQRISSNLRPPILDDLGIVSAIEWLAEDFQTRTEIKCAVTFNNEDIILDKDRSTAVFRIFQELLTNIARHANADTVKASLKKEKDRVMLVIKDNGRGINKEEISSPKSFGIIGMRERSHFVGGEVKISGVNGKGTTVTVTIPIS
jgi:signal transduction histidine kinase